MASASFEKKLRRYARLAVRCGMAVQNNQDVRIRYGLSSDLDCPFTFYDEAIIRLAQYAAQYSVTAGARSLKVYQGNDSAGFYFIQHANQASLDCELPLLKAESDYLVEQGAASLSLRTMNSMGRGQGISNGRVNRFTRARQQAEARYQKEGIGENKVSWCLMAAPSQRWARFVYPNLSAGRGQKLIWDTLFRATYADQTDCISRYRRHMEQLRRRADKLNWLGVDKLCFYGPGTELAVGLSSKSIFTTAQATSTAGVSHFVNIPSFEVYTTPNYRRLRGRVRVLTPVVIYGKIVEGISLAFSSNGKLKHFSAKRNQDALSTLVERKRAKYVGEIALVGKDSPLFGLKRSYGETLLDENGACHLALGRAYSTAIDAPRDTSDKDLRKLGANTGSTVHHDFPISDENTTVVAHTRQAGELVIIDKGTWWSELC